MMVISAAGEVPHASSSTTAPIVPSFFGITVPNSSTTWPVTVPFGTLGKTAGGSTYWAALEPENDTFYWTPLDNLIATARGAGVSTVMYTFFETPQWASSDPQQSCSATKSTGILGCAAPPRYISDWDRFVTALATRYAGQIQYYELWNEPNVQTEYSGNVTEMVAMAKSAYSIIKAVDPSAQVLSPGIAVAGIEPYAPGCSPSLCWLAEYLQAGGGQYADAVAFHGKTCLSDNSACTQEGIACQAAEIEACAGSSLVGQIAGIRSLLATYGISGDPLVNTEGGYSDEVPENNLWGSADQQAAFVSRFFIIQASEDLPVAVYFSWLANKQTGLMGFGTSSAESETNLAYEETRSWILGATFDGPCSLASGVWTCSITDAAGNQDLLVWADTNSSATSYAAPGQYDQYQDLKGVTEAITPGSPVPIDEEPVLLESAGSSTSSASTSASTSSASATVSTTTLSTASTSTGLSTSTSTTASSSTTSSISSNSYSSPPTTSATSMTESVTSSSQSTASVIVSGNLSSFSRTSSEGVSSETGSSSVANSAPPSQVSSNFVYFAGGVTVLIAVAVVVAVLLLRTRGTKRR
jgi:hypothetical protein